MARSIRFWVATIASFTATTTAALSPPTCQALAPQQETLDLPSANLTIPDHPFGIVYASNDIAFVGIGGAVGVLNVSAFSPTLLHQISFPESFYTAETGAGDVALTRDKSTLYVSVGPGAVIFDVERAIAGSNDSIIGTLRGTGGSSAIQVTLSADEDYAFVTQEYGINATTFQGTIEVFDLRRSSNGSIQGTSQGHIQLDLAVVGTALSADGSRLYALSELSMENAMSNRTGGTLSILDVETLTNKPANGLIASVDAGCQPVRVILSPDGEHVWVTARTSNRLLAYSSAVLDSLSKSGSNNAAAADALVASIQVGQNPVGVTFINNGSHIVTADSNRFNGTGATSGLTIVNVNAALNGSMQSFSRVPTGLFPREFAVSPDGKKLLVTQYQSKAIQAVDVSGLASTTNASGSGGNTSGAGKSAKVLDFGFVLPLLALIWL